jgi:hypothetical protein
MASPLMLSPININFAYRNRANGQTDTSPLATPANYASPATIDAALTAANGTYYTAATLAKMTLNDKIYALRQISDPGTI